jgi:hypothetical protein
MGWGTILPFGAIQVISKSCSSVFFLIDLNATSTVCILTFQHPFLYNEFDLDEEQLSSQTTIMTQDQENLKFVSFVCTSQL